MFCRNCGKELIGSPEFCPSCGAKPTRGTSFCSNCGAPTTPLTKICYKCGVRVVDEVVEKAGGSWMPRTAGILDLVAGVPALILGIEFAAGIEVLGRSIGAIIGIPLNIFAIIAIVGGVFALRKRVWGLALAGSISALFCAWISLYVWFFIYAWMLGIPWILGILAIVFTIMGKRHFR